MTKRQYRRLRKKIKKLLPKFILLSFCALFLFFTIKYFINKASSNQENIIRATKESHKDNKIYKDVTNTEPSSDKLLTFSNNYSNKLPELKKITVCIDAGHGGDDVGAQSETGKYEKEDTLLLCRLLKSYLESVGVNVIMTRNSDKAIPLDKRKEIAENSNVNLVISIHRNFYDGTEDVNGIEAWINSSVPNDSLAISQNILRAIEYEIPGINNRGVKYGSMDNPNENYALNKVSMPSLILEAGFMSSHYDNDIFYKHMEDYALSIARGIINSY